MPTGRRRTPSKTEEARARNKVNAQAVAGKSKPKATAKQKASTTRVSTNRAEKFTSTGKTGGSTRTEGQRKRDNATAKNGEVRMGAGGKFYNRYNASTGRWERVGAVTPASKAGSKKGETARAKNKSAVSKNKTIGRDTGNHKTTMYANGTARVWDPKQKKFVTVGKSNPLHPKYGK